MKRLVLSLVALVCMLGLAAVSWPASERAALAQAVDDTAALQAQLNGRGIVQLEDRQYTISDTLTVPTSTTLVGEGASAPAANPNDPQWDPSTEIVWAGGAEPMIEAVHTQGSRIEGLGLDGGGVATKGVYLDRFQSGAVRDVGIRNLDADSGIGIHTDASANLANVNTMFNQFENLYIRAATVIKLSGYPGGQVANTCHNTFARITGLYGHATSNAAGIVVDDADNNDLTGVYLYPLAGTGKGVELMPYARQNVFYSLQPGANGLRARVPATAGWSNAVIPYSRTNAQPAPTIDSGATLTWWDYSRQAYGGLNVRDIVANGPLAVHATDGTGRVELAAQSGTPPAPASGVRLWTAVNPGTGKTQLWARFPGGGSVLVSTQP